MDQTREILARYLTPSVVTQISAHLVSPWDAHAWASGAYWFYMLMVGEQGNVLPLLRDVARGRAGARTGELSTVIVSPCSTDAMICL